MIAEGLLQQYFDLPRLKQIPSGRVARRVGVGRGVASAAEPASTSAALRPLLRGGKSTLGLAFTGFLFRTSVMFQFVVCSKKGKA